MTFETHKFPIIIREHLLDTFGHVNNAAYLEIFEEARWEMISSRGFSLKEIMEKGQGPVILEINIKFMKELKLRESLVIETVVTEYSGKVGNIRQLIKRGDEVCCEMNCKAAFFDTRARKIILPTEEWMHAIGAHS
ncbi:MAG: thioesterase family protein [Bdellovibrionota bacterium]